MQQLGCTQENACDCGIISGIWCKVFKSVIMSSYEKPVNQLPDCFNMIDLK